MCRLSFSLLVITAQCVCLCVGFLRWLAQNQMYPMGLSPSQSVAFLQPLLSSLFIGWYLFSLLLSAIMWFVWNYGFFAPITEPNYEYHDASCEFTACRGCMTVCPNSLLGLLNSAKTFPALIQMCDLCRSWFSFPDKIKVYSMSMVWPFLWLNAFS